MSKTYRTGEKPGKGTYICTKCKHEIVLDNDTDTLPPCPYCNHTEYTKKLGNNMSNKKNVKIGKETVVIGDVSGGEVGDRSVVINITDTSGNVILDQTMAIGNNAKAAPGSIAIGAGAMAGYNEEVAAVLAKLSKIVNDTNDPKLISSFADFLETAKAPTANKTILLTKLQRFRGMLKTTPGVVDLFQKVYDWIANIPIS